MDRRLFLAGSAALLATPVAAEPRRMPVELVSEIGALPGLAALGSRNPDVTLYEFFDYNCGYCRQSAREIGPLIKGDKALRYVLVNFPVLAPESVLAARVALAFLRQKPKAYLAFHERMFAERGVRGSDAAIAIAKALGAKEQALLADADSDAATGAMQAAVKLGDNLGLFATPSYIAGADGNVGYMNLAAKKIAIASMRSCERMSCG
jgi:protein-disulfide isomerase